MFRCTSLIVSGVDSEGRALTIRAENEKSQNRNTSWGPTRAQESVPSKKRRWFLANSHGKLSSTVLMQKTENWHNLMSGDRFRVIVSSRRRNLRHFKQKRYQRAQTDDGEALIERMRC